MPWTMKTRLWNGGSLVLAVALAAGCGGDESGVHSDAAINEHVLALTYDRNTLLGVRNMSESERRTALGDPVDREEREGTNLLVCRGTDYSLESNADQVAILRPTEGIIWPGALVKANAAMLDGLPEPITLAPAPITLRVDLPGMGDHGTFVVEKPSNSTVQAGLDQALAWWNENAYEDGYVNAARSSYMASTAFTSEQLALDVGLNVRWATGSVASQFSSTSTATSSVAMMVFKQVFYTVTLDTPESPAAMFADTILHAQCVQQMTPSSPPAYVHSVHYGRILMFRMETSEAVKSTEMEATMKYAAGVKVDLSMESRYKSILQRSSISVITIGGNAEVAADAVTARSAGDLAPIIKGPNAVYSKSNPGVPIAYTVKFLKDNTIAKMGYTTSYKATECKVWKESRLTVHNSGAYIARAFARYYARHQSTPVTVSSGNFTAGLNRVLVVPAGATEVELWADAEWFIASWDQIGYVKWDVAPEAIKYCLHGTTLSHSWGVCN